MDSIAELVRRAAVVLVLVAVYLRVVLGLAITQKVHTPRPSRRPWGLEARTVRRIGPRLVALRVQLLVA